MYQQKLHLAGIYTTQMLNLETGNMDRRRGSLTLIIQLFYESKQKNKPLSTSVNGVYDPTHNS
jgi:hypothetical protein